MDNLTHTLTGILLARAGLSRLTPRAAWITALAANIPDIDVVTLVGGVDTYFKYHRWATHAILFAPVMAGLAVLAVSAMFRRKLPWFKAWLAAMVAVASHLCLDATNAYGIRLWLPFSDSWPTLDTTHVIDIWIWAILLTACFWPMLSSLVGSEIGSKAKPGKGLAIAALVTIVLYDSGRYVLHQSAIQTLESRVYDGAAPRRTVAFPHPANPLQWDGWVETEKSWQAVDVHLATEFDPQPKKVFWKADNHRSVEAARGLPVFQTLLNFARTPYWRVTPSEKSPGADYVELIDLRFGGGGRMGFTAAATVDGDGKILDSEFHF